MMPSPNRPTGPYQVVPDSDYLNRSIMKVVGPGAVCESIESAIEARRLANIANTAYAAGKRAVEGDLYCAAYRVVRAIAYLSDKTLRSDSPEIEDLRAIVDAAALASAGQEVKP
jgi:hypothetical protein